MTADRPNVVAATCDTLLIVVFAVLLLLPVFDRTYGLDPAPLPVEKRRLAQWPAWPTAWDEASEYPRDVETHVNDHFGFRAALVRANSYLRVLALRTSPNARVTVGKQGWLFAGENGAAPFQQDRPLDDVRVRGWGEMLQQRHAWLAERGIRFLFVAPPSKPSIYAEHLPPALEPAVEQSPYDQLLAYLDEHTDVNYIDLRPILFDAKQEAYMYDKAGIHWNYLAACIAAQEIIAGLRDRWFPELAPIPVERYRMKPHDYTNDDLALQLGMEGWFRAPGYAPMRTWKRRDKPAPPFSDVPAWLGHMKGRRPQLYSNPAKTISAVVARDSFGGRMLHYLNEHFRTVLYYPLEELYVRTEGKYKTDVFIFSICERALCVSPRVITPTFGDWGPPQKTPRDEHWPWPTEAARRVYTGEAPDDP